MAKAEQTAGTVDVASADETAAFAGRLAGVLAPGDVLCLSGDLGAGKTTFTRALVAALGSPAPVSSPTFTLIHEYGGGRIPVVHADAYRLRGSADVPDTGLDEYLAAGDSVTVIEWPERIAAALPDDRLELAFEDAGGDRRRVTVTAMGGAWTPRRAVLAKAVGGC